jgi:PAS domain S-box-containing protein
MRDVIEKTPVGICITKEERLFEYVNPAYTRIYGWTWDELVGRPFTVVVPRELQATMIELHDRFMRQEYELSGE